MQGGADTAARGKGKREFFVAKASEVVELPKC